MGARSGFFHTSAKPGIQQGQAYEVVDSGGGLFLAAAVSLIDYLQKSMQVNESVYKKILGLFQVHFPQYLNNERLTTPKERVQRLLNLVHSRPSELIGAMAQVLRLLVVDELYANPTRLEYRDILKQLDADTPTDYLTNPKTFLELSAFKALERVLGIPICLAFKEEDKVLRRLDKNPNTDAHAGLLIQVQQYQHPYQIKCYPDVKQRKADFTTIVRPTKAKSDEGVVSRTQLDALITQVADDDQRLLKAYQQVKNRISLNVENIDNKQLMDYYIALLPEKLHNNQYIIQLEHAAHPVIGKRVADDPLRSGLINTFASWIVADIISENQLFDRIENQANARALRAG